MMPGIRIASASPDIREINNGKRKWNEVRGADLYVQAEPGLTSEYLTLRLDRHLASMQGAPPDCVFAVPGTKVQVDSAGPGFVIRITAPDAKRGEEVARRAGLHD